MGLEYSQTGVVAADAPATWRAFVTFAAFAYDASVWNDEADVIVSLADEGQSCVVSLNDDDASRFRRQRLQITELIG